MVLEEKRVEICSGFRKKLFKKYGAVTNIANKLNISRMILNSFKNNYLKTIPYELFQKICQECGITK